MKEQLGRIAKSGRDGAESRNRVREYLQARILGVLQRSGAMIPLAFQGGTALRFLYRLPRYSEDLDFALERPGEHYRFREWLGQIRRVFTEEGYAVEVKVNEHRTVHSAFVGFPGLLGELGLSGHRAEVLSVKLEVDSRPPAGAVLETTVVRNQVLLQIQHHDRSSLLAGKVHALLNRPWLKGRDVFDLFWYLSDRTWPGPNFVLLNNALAQTGWAGESVDAGNWGRIVTDRLLALPWRRIIDDVDPFLEPAAGAELLTRQAILRLLADRAGIDT